MLPTMELMVRMAKVFEVNVDYLIRDKENATISKIKIPDLRQQIKKSKRCAGFRSGNSGIIFGCVY